MGDERRTFYIILLASLGGTGLLMLLSTVVFPDAGRIIAFVGFGAGVLAIVAACKSRDLSLMDLSIPERLCALAVGFLAFCGFVTSCTFSTSGKEWHDAVGTAGKLREEIRWRMPPLEEFPELALDDPAFRYNTKAMVLDVLEKPAGREEIMLHLPLKLLPASDDYEAKTPVTAFVVGRNYEKKLVGSYSGFAGPVYAAHEIKADIYAVSWPDMQPIGRTTLVSEAPESTMYKPDPEARFEGEISAWVVRNHVKGDLPPLAERRGSVAESPEPAPPPAEDSAPEGTGTPASSEPKKLFLTPTPVSSDDATEANKAVEPRKIRPPRAGGYGPREMFHPAPGESTAGGDNWDSPAEIAETNSGWPSEPETDAPPAEGQPDHVPPDPEKARAQTMATLRAFEATLRKARGGQGQLPPLDRVRKVLQGYPDGWGNPMHADAARGRVRIRSNGPDQQPGGGDDLHGAWIDAGDTPGQD